MDNKEAGKLVIMGRAEIDTRAPFRSVKEAVMLFGERVLVGEIYANKLKEIKTAGSESGLQARSRIDTLTAELEETKLSLQRAREEGNLMTYCIKSLKEELEQTKRELQWLKGRDVYQKRPLQHEIEDLKFVENTARVASIESPSEEATKEYQKKRYVKFASPLSLTKVIVTKEEMLERPASVKKTTGKRRSLGPIMGWLFSKRKGSQEHESPRD
ncbi:hypothetical protein K2173_006173 [Erythroxylum novogranatense]|uniref:WEB family protein n=1 Tax=Erythroxylum novogranatense TaxID=1862640 RepID=A0AAV8TEA3_9ROSI|nr:hypothetical protein K2173_006173 [Erythroxylum novogranatense]